MSAQATESDGVDLRTDEPMTHDFDKQGHTVLAECCVCCTNTGRRLLERDYASEDVFKQLVNGDYVPSTVWRYCEECGSEETHFVC